MLCLILVQSFITKPLTHLSLVKILIASNIILINISQRTLKIIKTIFKLILNLTKNMQDFKSMYCVILPTAKMYLNLKKTQK